MTSDFLVVGAGVAGLRAAIELAEAGDVLVMAKDSLRESSSEYAQGGIAVALSDDDEVELHEQDTLAAGAELCNPQAVHTLVEEGPAAIQQLIEWGVEFDREGTKLAFGREGAHSRSRILHAHGDSTGREISRTLYHKAASLSNIRFQSFTAITDLLVTGGEAAGVVACDSRTRRLVPYPARAVLLATGGLGRLYQETTNPDVATGDGVAAAYRAGAELSDLEFVQFHPTALYLPGAPSFLLTEALRGEGGYLRNGAGERFMTRFHPLAELAPRDIVSRAIVSEMQRTGDSCVFLDMTHLPPATVRSRFPRVLKTCLEYGVDITKDFAPVRPAAHYAMGGVWTDLDGRTSLPRLFAAGEVAATGVHGANRLASNSLLEAMVFGARAGRRMREWASGSIPRTPAAPQPEFPDIPEEELRRLTSEKCGIIRSGEGLSAALEVLQSIRLQPCQYPNRVLFELRGMHELAMLIARCGLARKESRGAHYRTDYPERLSEYRKHSRISRTHEVTFV
ncbi:MAG: L-aspartate oxidase [Bryobacterales bacterium]|nr:L-aspartate oxidase [Bryobacterales bacterium]